MSARAESREGGLEPRQPALSTASDLSGRVIRIDNSTDHVNLMGDSAPDLPSFPALTNKPGYVRGYVKDLKGTPLKGAAIGLKTATIGVDYLANSAVTDANWYYEIKIPLCGARFHFVGYTMAYGGGRAALGLYPSDGELSESYPARTGGVENFVLLPYGIASLSGLASDPKYRGNFYGGTLKLTYFIAPPGQDPNDFAGMLASGSELDITLAPEGKLIDGSTGRAFTIYKKVEDSSIGEFLINNVPVGRYSITVESNGRPLRLKQKSPTDSPFGLQPKEAAGRALLTFNPLSARPETAVTSQGNWNDLEIVLQR